MARRGFKLFYILYYKLLFGRRFPGAEKAERWVRGWEHDVRMRAVFARWAEIAGPEIADHCEPTALRDGELVLVNAAQAETPRLPDGKPDLTGSWQAGGLITGSGVQGTGWQVGGMFRRCTPFQNKQCMEWTNQSIDWVFMSTSRLGQNQPMYKPEHWNKVIELDQWTNKYDPVMTCKPLGLPRHGTPTRIVQTDKDVIFFYPINADYGGGNNEYRNIPTDGRALTEQIRSHTRTTQFLRALLDQDIYLSGAILLMYAALTILGTFLSDVLLALLDPRIRYGERV